MFSILGFRCLWVDSLSTVQDDPDQKPHDIANMTEIYKNANVIIIAEAATNANYALIHTPHNHGLGVCDTGTISFGGAGEIVKVLSNWVVT